MLSAFRRLSLLVPALLALSSVPAHAGTLVNLACELSTTQGKGQLSLNAGTCPGFNSFAKAGVINGQTVSYSIKDGNNTEAGRGLYSTGTPPTLTRSPLASTGTNNALISLSGTEKVYVSALAADFTDLQFGGINVKDYGAVCDGAHDDTQGFRDAITALRALIVARGYGAFIHIPTGTCYLTGSLNLQNINASYAPWGIIGEPGSVLYSIVPGHTVLDFAGSGGAILRGFTINAVASIGIQFGNLLTPYATNGGFTLEDLNVVGIFAKTAIYNGASELNLYYRVSAANVNGGDVYALVMDSFHHYPMTTDFQASAIPADTGDSLTNTKFVGCNFTSQGATVAPVKLIGAGVWQTRFDNTYIRGNGASEIVWQSVGAVATTFKDLYLDVHGEGYPAAEANYLEFNGTASAALTVDQLVIREANNFSSNALIKVGTNITSVTLTNEDISFQPATAGSVPQSTLANGTVTRSNGRVNGLPDNLYGATIVNSQVFRADGTTGSVKPSGWTIDDLGQGNNSQSSQSLAGLIYPFTFTNNNAGAGTVTGYRLVNSSGGSAIYGLASTGFAAFSAANAMLLDTSSQLAGGIALNTETTAPIIFNTNSTLRWTIDGTNGLLSGTGNLKLTTAGNYVQTTPTTVAGLTACASGTKGAGAMVTDANSTTFHATAAGGGANNMHVVCDGSVWYLD